MPKRTKTPVRGAASRARAGARPGRAAAPPPPSTWRPLITDHLRVRVHTFRDTARPMQRILVDQPRHRMAGTLYLTVQDAEHVIAALGRAVRRAPFAR